MHQMREEKARNDCFTALTLATFHFDAVQRVINRI